MASARGREPFDLAGRRRARPVTRASQLGLLQAQLSRSPKGHPDDLCQVQGVALGTNGYLWLTRNGGTSWSRVTV